MPWCDSGGDESCSDRLGVSVLQAQRDRRIRQDPVRSGCLFGRRAGDRSHCDCGYFRRVLGSCVRVRRGERDWGGELMIAVKTAALCSARTILTSRAPV